MIFSKRRLKLTEPEAKDSFGFGIYLGYPECCARSFMEHHCALTYAGIEYPLKGSGFVPCPLCAATYTDEELDDYIAANRYCSVYFGLRAKLNPDPNTNKELARFIEIITTEGVEIGNRKARRDEESPV